MVLVQLGYFAVLPELSLKLHLRPPQCFAAYRARLTAPRTAHRAIRTPHRQLSILDRFAGLRLEDQIIRHVSGPQQYRSAGAFAISPGNRANFPERLVVLHRLSDNLP